MYSNVELGWFEDRRDSRVVQGSRSSDDVVFELEHFVLDDAVKDEVAHHGGHLKALEDGDERFELIRLVRLCDFFTHQNDGNLHHFVFAQLLELDQVRGLFQH